MRRFSLFGTFLILLVAFYFLWQFRFEKSSAFSTVHLTDIREVVFPANGVEWLGTPAEPQLRLRGEPGHSGIVTRCELPISQPVEFLHLKFRASTRKLVPGKEFWQDGRCIIEWHRVEGEPAWENDPFYSGSDDSEGIDWEIVMRPAAPPAIPALRLENLGVSGDLELSRFEATVVKERLVWKIGRWVLVGSWFAWAVAWMNYHGPNKIIRPMLAGAIWVAMGIWFVVPGPWKSVRSIGPPFWTGNSVEAPQRMNGNHDGTVTKDDASATTRPPVLESVGKIPEGGDIALRIKIYAQNARSFLHAALLFGPTFLLACLVGRRSALSLAIVFALAIEFAQFSFGFGFDGWDVVDLACDSIGISIALLAHRRLHRIWPGLVAG